MKKHKKHHRLVATFFLLIFFPTLVPTNLFASNNGPVAPEAASFEPVDATDMVNLATGDMSYVLPLLNVPSPEGGYPLSLSYHAGIAMDQEASWVGAGWSLSPGAVNRSVKGVPDDWDKTRVSELLYDAGGTLDYYNFSIGGTLPNGVTIGMSRSWGAYQAWGGTVGYGPLRMDFGSDENKASVGIGSGSGSIGYSMSDTQGSSVSLRYGKASVSYNIDSKAFSGGVSGPLGISFRSNGSVGVSIGGISTNSLNTTASSGDYYTNVSTNGFDINGGFFWVGYQHTEVSYNLFKLNNNYISGTLNLYDSKKEAGSLQDNKSYMDVKHFSLGNSYDSGSLVKGPMINLPNYDNYSVSSQGLSGSFSPKIFDEVLLYGRGSQKRSLDSPVTYQPDEFYMTTPSSASDLSYKLNNKIFFYFDDVNSSFLRMQTGKFKSLDSSLIIENANYIPRNPDLNTVQSHILNDVVTENDSSFSSPYDNNGNLTKTGNRKRDGNFIEAFTNTDISNGNTNGSFLEVPGFDRQFYKSMAKDGIGAYRITTLDGKVYHYSLPVYNFEEVYKNYATSTNEKDKFIETVKNKPYATHWLLTAVTGPDYVDVNNNNVTDEGDYGYWVQFDYGKWSDGYGWRSPKVGAKVYNSKNFYFWGRKEIYYLDKIKTRTHTALFVKSVRTDDKSSDMQYRDGQYVSGAMTRDITQQFHDNLSKPIEQGYYFMESSPNTFQTVNMNYDYDYNHYSYKYVDLPENLSLKLDKIILLKNSDALGTNKNLATGTNKKIGYTYFDFGFFGAYAHLRKDPYDVRKSNINADDKVLDNADIAVLKLQGIDVENKSQKVINFNYDYSLGSNLPNASQGRLALRSVDFNGKSNSKVLPPYKFNYLKSNTPYNFTNADVWGNVKDNPDAWSLNEIITPIGTKIKVEYESDSFISEAAEIDGCQTSYSFPIFSNDPLHPVKYTIVGDIITMDLGTDQYSGDINNLFVLNEEIDLVNTFYKYGQMGYGYGNGYGGNMSTSGGSLYNYKDFYNKYSVVGIDNTNRKVSIKINQNTNLALHNKFFNGPYCCFPFIYPSNVTASGAYEYSYMLKIKKKCNIILRSFGPNGKQGGGLRVKSVTTSDIFDQNNTATQYDYRDPYMNLISGVTSYEPFEDSQKEVATVEEIPSPGVIYKYVTVSVKNNIKLLNKTVYKFKVLEDVFFDNLYLRTTSASPYSFGNTYSINTNQSNRTASYANDVICDKMTILDNFSNLGKLLSVESYNDKNHLMKRVVNNYKVFQMNDIDNGIVQETFKNVIMRSKYQNMGGGVIDRNPNFFFASISKVHFPSKLESTTSTQGGYSNTTYYDKYDFLTGQVVESHFVSSDGKTFKTSSIPAYLKYTEMGSKVDNPSNKNMLSQTAAEYSYIFDGGIWKETGVGITTWSNIWSYKDIAGTTTTPTLANEKIWRKHKSYIWNGVKDANGIFSGYNTTTGSGDDGFVWGVGLPQTNTKWKQASEVTLYDHYSATLEVKDVNGNLASTKMGDNDSKIMTTGNAGYSELFYAGAENITGTTWLEPEVKIINATRDLTNFHTGKYSVATTSSSQFGVNMKANEHRAGKYKLTVWVHKTNVAKARVDVGLGGVVTFNGETYNAGDWVLKTHYFTATTAAIYPFVKSFDGTTVYFDDLMIRPVASSVTGYVYNEWDELSYIVSNNGLATHFEYDAAGRLIRTSVEVVDDSGNGLTGGFKLKTENIIKYKNLP